MQLDQLFGRCRHVLVFCVAMQLSAVWAANGVSVGTAVTAPHNWVVALDVHAAVPVLRFMANDVPLLVAARADVSAPIDFSSAPALGVSALLGADDGMLRPYVGGGLGLSFLSGGSGVLASGFAYTGINYRFAGQWSAFLEGSVNLSAAGINPNVALGVSYTFGPGQ